MDRWPDFSPAASLRESAMPIDDYIKKLELRLSALDYELQCSREEAVRMQTERDSAVKELSIISEKLGKIEHDQAINQSIEASRGLHNALEAAELVLREVRNVGSVREDSNDLSKDLKVQELEVDLEEFRVHNGLMSNKLKDVKEENDKLRSDIANLKTDMEILQSVNIRFRNMFRNFAKKTQCSFKETDKILSSISGSRTPSTAGLSQSSIQGSLDANDGTQRENFGVEDVANVSFDNGMDQACGPAEEEILPAAFLEAVNNITPEEMAELEKAFENI